MLRWLLATALFAPLAALAGPMSWQGRLLDAAGAPLEGEQVLTFTLFDAPTDGLVVWTETHTVSLASGYASTVLGGQTSLDQAGFDEGARWLSIAIGSVELSRQRVLSVPVASHADSAATADFASEASDASTLGGSTGAQLVSQALTQLGQQTVTVGGLAVTNVGTVINASGQWVGPTGGLGTTLDCYATGWGGFSGCAAYPNAPIPACNTGYTYAGIHQYNQSDSGCGVSAHTNARMQARCCRLQ